MNYNKEQTYRLWKEEQDKVFEKVNNKLFDVFNVNSG